MFETLKNPFIMIAAVLAAIVVVTILISMLVTIIRIKLIRPNKYNKRTSDEIRLWNERHQRGE